MQANATNVTLSVMPASVGAGGTTYQYSISTDGTMNWVKPRVSTDTSHTFTGLAPETQYTVNVKIGDTAQTAQSVTTASQANMKDVTTVADAIKYSASAISATDTTYAGIYKELTDANNDTVKVPVGFTIRYDSAATVADGIVVADQNDNQWVWIPVNASNPYTRRDFENDAGWFSQFSESLTGAETNVATVGGYYIARYESGSLEDTMANTMRSHDGDPRTVTIRQDQVPYTYVSIDAYNALSSTDGNMMDLCIGIASDNNYKTGITTKLCSSYAWDTALNFIGNESWSKGTGYQSIRQNYIDSDTFKYKKMIDGVIIEADKITNSDDGIMLTGQGDATKNIYDMGGNCWDSITELCEYDEGPYGIRGGIHEMLFSSYSAGARTSTSGEPFYGKCFRATLYL